MVNLERGEHRPLLALTIMYGNLGQTFVRFRVVRESYRAKLPSALYWSARQFRGKPLSAAVLASRLQQTAVIKSQSRNSNSFTTRLDDIVPPKAELTAEYISKATGHL